MEREIWEQSEVLANTLARTRDLLHLPRPDLILLAARGSSDNAALYARYLFEIELGIPVSLAAPSVFTQFERAPKYPENTLCIGISQSGSAPDISGVVQKMRERGHATLAITNTPGSLITEVAALSICLDVGVERSVAATKTYTASLVALYEITRKLGANLPPLVLPDRDWIERCQCAANDVKKLLDSEVCFALGRSYHYCSAHETALKLMECSLVSCKAYSNADFEHGPKALMGERAAIVHFGVVSDGLLKSGSKLLTPPESNIEPKMAPIREIIYAQWLALYAAEAKGLDPDAPANLSKVTKTE